jgi:hypothetical protein
MSNFKNWQISISKLKQPLVSFVCYLAFWLIISIVEDFILNERKAIEYFVFRSVFMAIIFTLIFQLSKVVDFFKR